MILNEYQMAAINDEHQACIVNANVGSGKTTVLIEKIKYLHNEKNIDLNDMVVLTFTNKAADEIRGRFGQDTDKLWFGTFHSIAMRLLNSVLPVEELQYTKDFQVMLPEEELEIARTLIITNGLNIKYQNRLKKRMEDWERKRQNKYDDDLEILISALRTEKIRQNKMTYHDLICFAAELLKRHQDLFVPKWLIIDEVQDCDMDQLEFLDAMKQEHTCLFAVGDPNQVIYGWRGSAFQVFSLLKKKYDAQELSLPVNYRSTSIILQAASRFKQNGERLVAMNEEGDKIQIIGHYDPLTEADYLAGRIKELHEEGIPYSEIGVFYRLQNQSEILSKVLDQNQIPYEVSQKQQFMDIPILNWLYHLIRYLVNGEDQVSLVKLLTDKRYGDGMTEKKVLKQIQNGMMNKLPLWEQFQSWYQHEGNQEKLSEVQIGKLCDAIKLENRIGKTHASYREEKELADQFFKRLMDSGKTLTEFVNETALNGAFIIEEKQQRQDTVKLLTLHASKGLEFTCVFMIGANAGLLPLRGAGEAEEEEERRLFFVGMTRARKTLEISYYNSIAFPKVTPGPSPYLRMIRSECLKTPPGEKKDQKQAAEHLQSIKREILKNRSQEKPAEEIEEIQEIKEPKKTRISHSRYGLGYIISEDEEKILFEFDDFGEKEMIKMFCTYTIVE